MLDYLIAALYAVPLVTSMPFDGLEFWTVLARAQQLGFAHYRAEIADELNRRAKSRLGKIIPSFALDAWTESDIDLALCAFVFHQGFYPLDNDARNGTENLVVRLLMEDVSPSHGSRSTFFACCKRPGTSADG